VVHPGPHARPPQGFLTLYQLATISLTTHAPSGAILLQQVAMGLCVDGRRAGGRQSSSKQTLRSAGGTDPRDRAAAPRFITEGLTVSTAGVPAQSGRDFSVSVLCYFH
jgi:hypothetical protein